MPEKETSTFGLCLRAARIRAGYRKVQDAAMHVPISVTMIGRHERGEVRLPPEDVMEYARAYEAPEVIMRYCRMACPIGCRTLDNICDRDLAELATRAFNRLKSAPQIAEQLTEIADDGVIDTQERPLFDSIIQTVREYRVLADELELLAVKLKVPTNPLQVDMRRRVQRCTV